MRILSQDGMADLPYESIGICIHYHNKTDIIAYPAGTYSPDDEYWTLAKYSTEAKARKAMEMLLGKYSTLRMQEVIDRNINQAVYERIEKEDKEKFFSAFFQFPADDEAEV